MRRWLVTTAILAASAMPLGCREERPPPGSAPAAGSQDAKTVAWPGKTSGHVTLEHGQVVTYSYHYNRNAITDSRAAGDSLIALTEAGHLIRFDLGSLRPTGERVFDKPVALLGTGAGGEALAILSDATVHRINPATLGLMAVAELPELPRWVGCDPAGRTVLAVGGRGIWDVTQGKKFEIPYLPLATTFLIDGRRRLWMGLDRGEWGGWCGHVDLATGKLHDPAEQESSAPPEERIPWAPSGVYGLVALSDGQVWAFGGMSHMGSESAFIARMDGRKPRRLFAAEFHDRNWFFGGSRPAKPAHPVAPITHIIEEPGGRLLVFSYGQVFGVDRHLKQWRHVTNLSLQYIPGRPDAMSAYPALRRIHPVPGRKGELVCTTALDGILRLTDGKPSRHVLPNQFEARTVKRIQPTPAGTLLWEYSDHDSIWDPPWRLVKGQWQRLPLLPPIDPGKGRAWQQGNVVRTAGTAMITAHDSAHTSMDHEDRPGPMAIVRWRGGKGERVASGDERIWKERVFATPDGQLWMDAFGRLKRLEADTWRIVAPMPTPLGQDIQVIDSEGPPWLLLGSKYRVMRLSLDEETNGCRLEAVPLTGDDGKALKVLGAAPLGAGKILMATSAGMRTFDVGTGKLTLPDTPIPKGDVSRMCRDGSGRIWMAGRGELVESIGWYRPGRGLWMLDPRRRVLYDMSAVPVIGHATLVALGADAEHPDGVAVFLRERGVMFLRARLDSPEATARKDG